MIKKKKRYDIINFNIINIKKKKKVFMDEKLVFYDMNKLFNLFIS